MSHMRVVVVDDHTLIRQGIVGLLDSQADIEVIAQGGTGQEGIALAAELHPDVVLMDVSMPGMSGLAAAREIKARQPEVAVLILTIHDREDYLYQALRAGASGYVLKGADVNDLLAALRSAHRGEVYLSPAVAKALVGDYLRRSREAEADATSDGLTEREREILLLIAQGRTTAEIAADLVLSPHTVQSHRDHIMTKLDLHSKSALMKYALAKGLIEL
jgi:two-component system response regulator NreC